MADTLKNESMIPVINDHPQVVTQPVDKEPVIVEGQDALWKDHPPRLSKNMKLSMRHLGFVENAINVSEEWKYVDGEAVPPVGRDTSELYTKKEEKKYSDYGKVEYVESVPYKDDPAGEVSETIKVTEGTQTKNDDTDFVDAVPVMALNLGQALVTKTEGRHGEVSYDPITNENYLTRPGMEVKTSETYLFQQESETPVEPTNTEGEAEVPKTTESETPVEPTNTEGEAEVPKTTVVKQRTKTTLKQTVANKEDKSLDK
jgi:hypothetical protein